VGGHLINYDMLGGVGTGRPSLIANPSGEDITGQVFIMVSPVDHLRQGGTPQPPPLPPPSGDSSLDALRAEVAVLRAAVEALKNTPWSGKIALRSAHGTYVCADAGYAENPLMANRERRQSWETFDVEIVD
jgi:hypothetical protein